MHEICLDINKCQLINKIENILDTIEIRIIEFSENKIIAYYGGNLFSFGNEIEIIIDEVSPSSTLLRVNSKSAFKIQLIDWGANERIENHILNSIKYYINL